MGTEPVRARKQAVQSAPAFEETSLNANPHIFLSVCSFLLIDMGLTLIGNTLIGNIAKEKTDCVLSIIAHFLLKIQNVPALILT